MKVCPKKLTSLRIEIAPVWCACACVLTHVCVCTGARVLEIKHISVSNLLHCNCNIVTLNNFIWFPTQGHVFPSKCSSEHLVLVWNHIPMNTWIHFSSQLPQKNVLEYVPPRYTKCNAMFYNQIMSNMQHTYNSRIWLHKHLLRF